MSVVLFLLCQGAGTNDDQLIRCVVSRCEVDMVEIKQAFQSRYGKSLKSFIEVCVRDYVGCWHFRLVVYFPHQYICLLLTMHSSYK